MKYFVCVLFLAGAAVAQWGNDDGQWHDDTHQWNQWSGNDNGQWHGDNNGQWNGDNSGQWNPAADGSLAGQYNPAANHWAGNNWAGAPAQQWGTPGVPHDTPEVAAAKAAHLAAHAAIGHRWRRAAVIAAAPYVAAPYVAAPYVATPLAATHTVLGAHSIVAPHFVTTHHTALW